MGPASVRHRADGEVVHHAGDRRRVMSIAAVGSVFWMIFWMRRASRTIAGELRERMTQALEVGTGAVILLAFLAVSIEDGDHGDTVHRRDPRTGRLDAGLFFLAYQRDPRKHFVQVQRNLSEESLNEYI